MRRLHLGCFDRAIDGWVNADVSPHVYVGRVPGAARLLRGLGLMTAERFEQHQRGVFKGLHHLDLTRRFPYREGEFEAVFSAHVFEHLYKSDVERCAGEVRRVLAPGACFASRCPTSTMRSPATTPSTPKSCCS